VQGRLWGAAAADWSQLTEPAMTPVYEAVLDATGVGPGTRLLDAGCGSGLALQLAHKRGATVSGLDASAALLAVAHERLPVADLREGDLERCRSRTTRSRRSPRSTPCSTPPTRSPRWVRCAGSPHPGRRSRW
jgi:trans-aconitate methyltransferase